MAMQLEQLLPYIASILTGGIVAVFAEPLRQWIYSPKLKLSFEANNDDYRSFTTMRKTDGSLTTHAYYIRIKVENISRHIAKSCRAHLTNIEIQNDNGQFEPTIYADSLPLLWSCRNEGEELTPADLPFGVRQFIDVIATGFNKDGTSYFVPQIVPRPYRYESLFDSTPKILRFTIQVSGESVTPKFIQLIFKWNGKWDDFELSEDVR